MALITHHSRNTLRPNVKEVKGNSTSALDNLVGPKFGGTFNPNTGKTDSGYILNNDYKQSHTYFVVEASGPYILGEDNYFWRGDIIICTDLGFVRIPTGELSPSGGGGSGSIGIMTVPTMSTAYSLPPSAQYLDMPVYDAETDKIYILEALPANIPTNWVQVGKNSATSSYRPVDGPFDPGVTAQQCNTNQTILSSSMSPERVYKIYATADLTVTFDLPVLGSSPMISADRLSWYIYQGEEISFYVTADGLNIDAEVR